MAPLDYNKWKSVEFSDDDEDDAPRRPRVTRLEGGSRITLGADQEVVAPPASASSGDPMKQPGPSASAAESALAKPGAADSRTRPAGFDYYSKWDKLVVDDSDEEGDGMDEEEREEDPLDASEQQRLQEVLKETRGPVPDDPPPPPTADRATRHATLVARASRNGARREGYLWRQGPEEVEISVIVPPGTRAKQVAVRVVEGEEIGQKQLLRVELRGGRFLERELAYPVQGTGGKDDELAWELVDFEDEEGARLLRVGLTKVGAAGVVVWWGRAFAGEEEADTQAFPDRKRGAAAGAQQDVWAQAQAMFKQSVKEREARGKTIIDVGDEAPDELDQHPPLPEEFRPPDHKAQMIA